MYVHITVKRNNRLRSRFLLILADHSTNQFLFKFQCYRSDILDNLSTVNNEEPSKVSSIILDFYETGQTIIISD